MDETPIALGSAEERREAIDERLRLWVIEQLDLAYSAYEIRAAFLRHMTKLQRSTAQ